MTRAFENALAIAMTNWPEPKMNGQSMAIDAAFFGESGDALEPLIARAGTDEEILIAPVDVDHVRRYWQATIWGTTFRRAETYGRLAAVDPVDPTKLSNIQINGNTRLRL